MMHKCGEKEFGISELDKGLIWDNNTILCSKELTDREKRGMV